MLLEINMGFKRMKRKANALAKYILGFLNPKYLKTVQAFLLNAECLLALLW